MTFLDYIKDKLLFILINVVVFSIIAFTLIYINFNIVFILLVFVIWFLPLFSYITIEYIRFRNYYLEIEDTLENLDKKYLLPEVVESTCILEGQVLNNILKIVSRDMHENINFYKNKQNEYREYIETWVHEIKTPIASTKLVIENDKNTTTEKINQQINKIENFVEQVLYYSRSNNVEKDYIVREVNLENIVKNVVKRNYKDFLNKRIKLELEETYETVYTDTKWIEFIINQIIINSVKYSKNKGAKIKIKSYKKKSSVVLTIEDNGVGICENDIENIFKKGFTGENGRKFGQSTGIGLYLCKKLSEKLGINITVKSKLNYGTKVNLVFPKKDIL